MQEKRTIRIYPTDFQGEQLSHWFGQSRYSYNYFLQEKKNRIPNGQISKNFTEHRSQTDFLQEVPRSVQVCSMRNAATAFQRFFRKQAKFPRFKNKSKGNKCQVQLDTRHAAFLKNWNSNILQIPGLGIVKFRDNEKLKSLVGLSLVISISKRGSKYFISYGYDASEQLFPVSDKIIGIDVGLTNFITTDTGFKVPNPQKLKAKQRYLRREQRILSRRKIGSKRREKQKIKVGNAHLKVVFQRKDFQHKLALSLLRDNGIIILETLKIKNMVKNRKLSKSISDAAWGGFIQILKDKAKRHGRHIVQIYQFFASSKTCSCCKFKLDKLDLSIREWTCSKCNSDHDRDINAAINIRNEGIKILVGMGYPEYTHEETVLDINNLLEMQLSMNRESVEFLELRQEPTMKEIKMEDQWSPQLI